MGKIKRILPSIPNWELIAFFLIDGLLVGNNPFFSRRDLMSQNNIDFVVTFSSVLNHKNNPQHPEETLQRTIQNIRNKGLIEFLGNGEYKLTQIGIETLTDIRKKYSIKSLRKLTEEKLMS